jgi:hypothetical protein
MGKGLGLASLRIPLIFEDIQRRMVDSMPHCLNYKNEIQGYNLMVLIMRRRGTATGIAIKIKSCRNAVKKPSVKSEQNDCLCFLYGPFHFC